MKTQIQVHEMYLLQRGSDNPLTNTIREDSELLQLFPKMTGEWEEDKEKYIENYNEVYSLVNQIFDESNLKEDLDGCLYIDNTEDTEENYED